MIIGHTLKINLQLFCPSTLSSGGAIYRTVFNRRVQHIKTALMISLVVLIYIFAFMTAWLMALEVLTYNVVIFYFYFAYNVANPIIYTFLNESFRNHLQTLVSCRSYYNRLKVYEMKKWHFKQQPHGSD